MKYKYASPLYDLPIGHRIVNAWGQVYEKIDQDNWRPEENSHGLWWYKDSLSLVIGSDWDDA